MTQSIDGRLCALLEPGDHLKLFSVDYIQALIIILGEHGCNGYGNCVHGVAQVCAD